MLKIDKIDNDNIRIQQDSIDVTLAPIFFASAGKGGMITISPKSNGIYRSFSDTLENVEINGVNGSEFTPKEVAQTLNSFVGNFYKGGGASENNPAEWGEITGNIEDQEDLVTMLEETVYNIQLNFIVITI